MGPDELVFERRFQIWLYTVGHRQLLLRSNKDDNCVTRVDILFKDVLTLQLPSSFENLSITEISRNKADALNIQVGSQLTPQHKIFRLRGSNFIGYVVAGMIAYHEDEGNYYDKSFFSKSFAVMQI
jgi:hypothetical protein